MSETTPATPAATDTPPAAPAPAPTAPAPAWHSAYQGEDLGWLQNRGYDKLGEKEALDALLKQTRSLESLRGVPADRLLTLPQDMTAENALDAVYARLGRPEKPDGYGFKPAEDGNDADYVTWISDLSHGLGLNPKQAEKLNLALRDTVAKSSSAEAEAAKIKSESEFAALKAEWKDTYDLNFQIAQDTARKLGVTDEQSDALEAALGSSAALVKLFAKIGVKSGEAPYVNGDAARGDAVTTPEAAQQKMNELMKDAAFVDRFYNNDTEARNTISRLSKIASGQRPTAA